MQLLPDMWILIILQYTDYLLLKQCTESTVFFLSFEPALYYSSPQIRSRAVKLQARSFQKISG